MNFSEGRIDLERQASDGAGEGEIGHQYFLPIAVKQGEDALDGIGAGGISGPHDDGLEMGEVPVEDGVEQVLLALEEKIKTAAVGAGLLENFGHARGFVSVRVEEFDGGEDDAIASVRSGPRHG